MNQTAGFRKAFLVTCALAVLPCFLAAQGPVIEEKAPPANPSAVSAGQGESDSLVRVVFPGHKNWRRVNKGTVLEGHLSLPLYAGGNVLAPSDSTVRVTVNSVERIREQVGFWRKSGRAIVRAFNPLETNHPSEYRVGLSAAELLPPTGQAVPLDARVVRASSGVMVQPKSNTLHSAGSSREKPTASNILLMAMRSEALPVLPAEAKVAPVGATAEQRTARAYLLTNLQASTNHPGDAFRAQLAEPVSIGGRIFPPQSVVEGTIVRSAPPRMLSRAGRLYLRVERIVPVEGETLRVSGSLSGAEAEAHSHEVLDEEGTLHGRKPGLMNGLVDAGYGYFVGKLSDDIAETPIRAIGASMSDAAVANAARYVGLGSSVAFLITRHGRDVSLPKYSLIEISFGRVNDSVGTANADANKDQSRSVRAISE